MSTLAIIVVVVVALFVLLALGGAVANARRQPDAEHFAAHLDEVNRALATAHAQDKGWDPATVEAAARRAAGELSPGAEVRGLQLITVVDRPGTDADQAIFRVVTPAGESQLVLGRRDGEWFGESLA